MSDKSRANLVSVITPCYNAAPFVAETIASVAAQRYRAIEHIVVDDGSSDGSWDVIRSFGNRIHAERRPRNLGASAARNFGFARAAGEFLMFLDADDALSPDAIGCLIAALWNQPEGVALCEWRRLVEVDGAWRERLAEIPLPVPGDDLLRGWIDLSCWVPPCAILWRRKQFERTGGWDETLSLDDDADLMMGALASGMRFVRARGGIAYYRFHDDARLSLGCQVFSQPRLASRKRVLDKLIVRLDTHGRMREYTSPLALAYYRLALLGYQQGFTEFARASQLRAEGLSGRHVPSRTAVGRLLARTLGLERKERIVQWLDGWGLATAERRRFTRLRQLQAQQDQASRAP